MNNYSFQIVQSFTNPVRILIVILKMRYGDETFSYNT